MKACTIFLLVLAVAPWTQAQDPAGSALRFDGSDDRVTIPYAPALDVLAQFTLEAWVFPATADQGGIAGMWGYQGLPDKFLLYLDNGQLVGRISRDGVFPHDIVSSPIEAGRWTHVALRFDGADLTLFMNGSERASTPAPGTLASLEIGLDFGIEDMGFDGVLAGQLDEVRLWSIARSGREILLDMATAHASGTSGLVGSWSFNEGEAEQAVLDSSGWSHHGVRGFDAGFESEDPSRQASSAPIQWSDLGQAVEGSLGTPVLRGVSAMNAGSRSYLELSSAKPSSSAALIVGFSQADTPLLGGVLVPSTDVVIFGLPTNAAGKLVLEFHWPAALQVSPAYFQAWTLDGEATFGFSASNGLMSFPD